MNSYIKTLINNINSVKYMRNINRITPADDLTGNNPVSNKANFDGIIQAEEDLRYKNLKVFTNAYAPAKMRKFFVFTLPAMLSAATIASFVVPNHYEKEKNLKMYNVETTTLSSDLGQNVENAKYYSAALYNDIISEPDLEYLPSSSDKVNFRIYDGTKSVVASLNLSNDGSLSVSSIDAEDVIDVKGIEDKEYEELDPKYAQLFDDIIDILRESNSMSKTEEEELNRLTNLDKARIVVEILKVEYLGKQTVTVNASHTILRIILLVATAVYMIVEAMTIGEMGGLDENDSIKIGYDGALVAGGDDDFGFWFGPIKYRELFMKAERDRILKTWELVKENVAEEDRYKIFTRFEKKLIKKHEKNN